MNRRDTDQILQGGVEEGNKHMENVLHHQEITNQKYTEADLSPQHLGGGGLHDDRSRLKSKQASDISTLRLHVIQVRMPFMEKISDNCRQLFLVGWMFFRQILSV